MKKQALELKNLHKYLRDEIKRKWNRTLPFGEEFTDRWEKAKYLNFGKKANIYDTSLVFGDVKVGQYSWIGPFTVLDGTAGLAIGSYCCVSTGSQIYTHDSIKWALSGGKSKFDYAPVKIGDFCYIGPNAVISKGVTIGHHSIVGALSLVNKSFPPFNIVCGIPAKAIGKVKVDRKGKISLAYFKKDETIGCYTGI